MSTDILYPDMELWGLGYEPELEDKDWMVAESTPLPFCAGQDFEPPEEMDPRPWFKRRCQAMGNSCAGASFVQVMQLNNFLGGGDEDWLGSIMYAYLMAQYESGGGMFGRDAGAAIVGAAKAAQKDGLCSESDMPYPIDKQGYLHYSTKIAPGAKDMAGQHKITMWTVLHSYEEIFTYLSSGNGGVQFGSPMYASISKCRGVLEELSTPTQGAHAMSLVGYTKKVDRKQRKYLLLPQTWYPNWGVDGWAEVAPSVADWWAKNSIVVGYSTMTVYEPKNIDWSMRSFKPRVQAA